MPDDADLDPPPDDLIARRTIDTEEEMLARVTKTLSEGVTLSVDIHNPKDRARVTAIHWRPGDPNALAAIIAKHVHGPMRLELDHVWYTIAPEDPDG